MSGEFVDTPGPDSAPGQFKDEHGPDAPKDWLSKVKPVPGPNGSTIPQRPDGAVYIKESDDPRFKGQEGWKFLDPKTQTYVPAPAVDASASTWLGRHLGPDPWKNMARNFMVGFNAPGQGLQALGEDMNASTGLVPEETVKAQKEGHEADLRYAAALRNTGGLTAKLDQFTGAAAPAVAYAALTRMPPGATPVNIPGMTSIASKAPYISELAHTGLTAMPYTAATEVGDARERLKAGIVGGIVAPLMQAGLDKVVMPAVEGFSDATMGGIKRLVTGSGDAADTAGPAAKAVTAAAKAHDVPLTVGETLGPDSKVGRLALGVEKSGEPVSSWFTDVNQGHAAAGKAATRLLGDIQAKGKAMGFQNEGMLNDALAKDPGNAQLKILKGVIDNAQSGNPADIAQASADLKNWGSRTEIGKIFEDARASSAVAPVKFSPLKNTTESIDAGLHELEELPESIRKANPTFRKLEGLRDDYKQEMSQHAVPTEAPEPGGITPMSKTLLGPDGLPAPDYMPKRPVVTPKPTDLSTYNGMDRMRSYLGDQIRNTKDPTEARIMTGVKNGIEKDQQALADANPGTDFAKQFNEAKTRWYNEVVPSEDKAVARAMQSSTSDEIWNQFMKRGPLEDRGQKWFGALDDKGQNAVKQEFLTHAVDAATDRTKPGNPFDASKFTAFLDQYRGARSYLFKGDDATALGGLDNVLQHLKARGSSGVNPSFFSAISAGGAGVMNGPLRPLLLAADGMRPGSSALSNLLTRAVAIKTGASMGSTINDLNKEK